MSFYYHGQHSACPVCGQRKSDCRSMRSGTMHFCRRRRDSWHEVPGMRYVGLDKQGVWGVWVEGTARDFGPRPHYEVPVQPVKLKAPSRFGEIDYLSQPLQADSAAFLAADLGVPVEAVAGWRVVHYGYECEGFPVITPYFTLPEFGPLGDGWGEVGIACRYPQVAGGNQKRTHGNPNAKVKRGLIVFKDWDLNPDGPVFLVEGAGDVTALRAMGLSAIGRPNNRGGAEAVAEFVRRNPDAFPPGRELVAVAENDKKEDGSHPGVEGGTAFATDLAGLSGRTVTLALPPGAFKDSREWFNVHWLDGEGIELAVLAAAYAADLAANVVKVFRHENVESSRKAAAKSRMATEDAAWRASEQGQTYRQWLDEVIPELARMGLAALPSAEEQAAEAARLEALNAQITAAARRDFERYDCPDCRRIFQFHKQGGEARDLRVRCERWSCPGCAAYLRQREMTNASFRCGQADELYEFGCDEAAWPCVSRRLRRAKANYLTVVDGAGRYVICDKRVEGSIPCVWETAVQTVETCLEAYTGETRPVSTSRGWRLPRDENRLNQYETIGPLPRGLTEADFRKVANDHGLVVKRVAVGDPLARVLASRTWGRAAGHTPLLREDALIIYEALCTGRDPRVPVAFTLRRPGSRRPPDFSAN